MQTVEKLNMKKSHLREKKKNMFQKKSNLCDGKLPPAIPNLNSWGGYS